MRDLGGHAGFAQADGDDGGVPDGREAGFDPDGVGGFVLESFEFLSRDDLG
jgi:hypothetical protein